MTVQQRKCYETATSQTQKTNGAEISEIDKRDYIAEQTIH